MSLLNGIDWKDEADYFEEEQNRIDERVNRDFSKGSGSLEEDEKIYNKWLRHHGDRERMTAKEFSDEIFVFNQDLEFVMYEIHCTAEYFGIEFIDAIIISDIKYRDYNEGDELNLGKYLDRWNLAIKVINNAFNETPTKLQNAVDTLLGIDADIPIELTKSIMIRENYKANQKSKALTDAFNAIFPDVKHKPTIEIIVNKSLK